jgi:hypothetical protein
MTLLETQAIKEVGAKCPDCSEPEVKAQVHSLYDSIFAQIKDSERVMSNDDRDKLIIEEMESQAMTTEEYPDTYKWLKECFLGRTL